MSGGSFGYLCFKELQDLFLERHMIQAMAVELDSRGYSDVAALTRDLMIGLDTFIVELEPRRLALSEIWRAVEWTVSGDTGPDTIAFAVDHFRREGW